MIFVCLFLTYFIPLVSSPKMSNGVYVSFSIMVS